MARSVRNAKIDTRSARARLTQRREPYWTVISEGCAVGYRRGLKGGSWVARFRDASGRQRYSALGAADDARDADGITVYNYAQAQEAARAYFVEKAREQAGDYAPKDGPYTVKDAMADYRADYLRRGGKAIEHVLSVEHNYILPDLGDVPVKKLTRRRIEHWHESIANTPPRVRAPSGAATKFRTVEENEEAKRGRKATANRVLTVLKAALNHALHRGRVTDASAWQAVKAFRGVDAARMRYLSDDEVRRLVNVCPPEFRNLATAALLTGCRYGELARLAMEDFDPAAGTITVRSSKSGKPRHVALTEEGIRFFARQVLNLPSGAKLLRRSNGRSWAKSEQQRPLQAAVEAARISALTFHGLRHTYASRLAMNGVPLAVIAAQLGHADTRMVEKHYGHLAPNYIAETVRTGFTSLGIVETDNVVPQRWTRSLGKR
jgi:integrase